MKLGDDPKIQKSKQTNKNRKTGEKDEITICDCLERKRNQ